MAISLHQLEKHSPARLVLGQLIVTAICYTGLALVAPVFPQIENWHLFAWVALMLLIAMGHAFQSSSRVLWHCASLCLVLASLALFAAAVHIQTGAKTPPSNPWGQLNIVSMPAIRGITMRDIAQAIWGEKSTVLLRRNPDARPAAWPELLEFLRRDLTHLNHYSKDIFDCKHFSATLFNRAHQQGFQAYFAKITYGPRDGHAVVAFPTVDRGLIHVDVTPVVDRGQQIPSRVLTWVHVGKQNDTFLPLEKAGLDFQNNLSEYSVAVTNSKTIQDLRYF